jgi:riboflavin biosynthesis pyrimidine reductase
MIFPVEGPDLHVTPRATAGPTPAAVAELASYYGNGAATANPLLRANMVTSADGAASLGGRTGRLSGPADRMLFIVLRSLADLILVGAGTVRAERYRPVSEIWAGLRPDDAPIPAIAVVSGSLDLDPDSALLTGAAPGAQTIVITTGAAPPDKRVAVAKHARVIEAGNERLDLVAAVNALRGLGYRSILTEGGPALLGHLAAAELVDELCLTTTPVLAGGSASRITTCLSALAAPLSLVHVLHDDGFLFCRYRRE